MTSATAMSRLRRGNNEVLRRCPAQQSDVDRLTFVVAFSPVTAFAPLLAPFDPTAQSLQERQGPSQEHLLGTDAFRRYTFSRMSYGALKRLRQRR